MRIEYRLNESGDLLDPDSDQAEYRAATMRWVVQSLPASRSEQRQLQADLLKEFGMVGGSDPKTHAHDAAVLADAVLGHGTSTTVFPEDVVALRVALLRLSENEPEPVTASSVHAVMRGDHLVTTSASTEALHRLIAQVKGLSATRRKASSVVVRTLSWMVHDDAAAIADTVAGRTATLEDSVFASQEPDDDVVEDIYVNKRIVAELRRHLLPVINRLGFISETDGALDDRASDALDRVKSSMRRLSDTLDTDDRLLGDILAAQMTIVQVQQNNDMRRISAYAALITVPTLIAGIYGMNFDNIPILTWQWGYPLCLAVMTALVLWLRAAFKKSGWL